MNSSFRIASSILRRNIVASSAAAETATRRHLISSLATSTGRSSLVATTSRYNNHATIRSFSAATDSLVDLLSREHAEEMENDTSVMPKELEDLKKKLEKEWKIVEENATTRMYKTISGSKVQLSFHCQDTVETAVDEYVEEGEEELEAADPIKFTVTVTKAGKTLIFTCLSEDAVAKIQSCAVSAEDVETIQKEGGTVPLDQYQGPEFTELAEDLQDAFHTYLEEDIGIDTDCAAFVSMYTDYKEQNQYVKFLEDAKSILV